MAYTTLFRVLHRACAVALIVALPSCDLVGDSVTVAEGVVVNGETDAPLPGITVDVSSSLMGGGPAYATVTDQNGRFRLEWPTDDFIQEQVVANGRWDFPIRGVIYPHSPNFTIGVARTPEGERTTVRIELNPTHSPP